MRLTPSNPSRLLYPNSGLRKRGWTPDKCAMTPEKLDFIFPFIVFTYGLLIVVVLENPALVRIGEQRLGETFHKLSRHKNLAWVCFFLGGIWSAQNVWFSTL
jgi:hypothetical protein